MHLYREEDFGVIYGKPLEKIYVYRPEVLPFLEQGVEEVSAYKQPKIKIVRNNFHLRAPVIAFIELTRACNLRCRLCYNNSGKRLENELTTDEILALLDQLDEMKVFVVYFTGGEPLLRADFHIILEYANSLGFQVGMITNGTLINGETLKNIPARTSIGISIDGIKEIGRIRDGVTFEKLERVFDLLNKEDRYFCCMITLTKPGLPELDKLFYYLMEKKIWFSYYHSFPLGRGGINHQLILTPEDLPLALHLAMIHIQCESLFASSRRDKSPKGLSISNYWSLVYRLEESFRLCKGGRFIAYIQADGTVYPCSNCASAGLLPAGNIRQRSFKELWQESFREIRAIHWDNFSECKDCSINKSGTACEFRCPPLSKKYHNDPFKCGATPFLKKFMLFFGALDKHTSLYNITYDDLIKEMFADPGGWPGKRYLDQIMRDEIPCVEK